MKGRKTGNKHRGSSFENFLKQEGLLENIQAAAFKRALALKVNDMMKEKRMNKSAMATRMRTSRAAVHRVLNVPFEQTTDLVEKLRAHKVEFEELIIPDEIHDLLRWTDWVQSYTATADFLDRKLAATPQP